MAANGNSAANKVPNLEYTFQTVDEEYVSSKADGKPKLIIFYGASCGHCTNTLGSFTEKKIDGIDVLAVEVKNSSKDQINALKSSLGVGRETIQFCYDLELSAFQARIAYEQAYNGMTYSSLPVLCYIDENDQITYMTAGEQNLSQIKSNLAVYCNLKTTNLNLNNPSSAVFETIDGEEVSLTANEQPKVLIFYTPQGTSSRTLQSISKEKISGVDIYALDVITQTEEDTRQFAEQYISDSSGIKVCQGQDSILEMIKYTEAVGETGTITYPVICYIDADNKLQHVTIGESNLAEVKLNLITNCGYIEQTEEEIPEEPISDTTAPTAAYQIGNSVWKSFGDSSSYGVFSKEAKTLTIKAKDDSSGVDSVEYYVSNQMLDPEEIPSWTTYENTGISLEEPNTYVVYVRVKDKAGNSAVFNSEGIVIYEDAVLEKELFEYTEKINEDLPVGIELKGNTIKEITDNAGSVLDAANYAVTVNGEHAEITLKASYLNTLNAGEHTYQIYLNPQGIETNIVQLTYNFKLTVKSAEPEKQIDKAALYAAIEAAEALKAENYVDFTTVAKALENAKNVVNNESATQLEVNEATEILNVAMDALKSELGVTKFKAVVIATGTNFADALSGSYLAAVKNAPILLTNGKDANVAALHDYIKENLSENGTVYILGGAEAVPENVEAIDGYKVKRLAGNSRYETNLKILEEAGITGTELIVATGKEFADSLSASAAQRPILLVKPNTSLTDAQKAVAEQVKDGKIYIVGGKNAVSAAYEKELSNYAEVIRVAGENRQETSVKVAETFFADADSVIVASAKNYPDGLCGGPLAAAMNIPLLLTTDGKTTAAEEYVAAKNLTSGIVLGGSNALSDESVAAVFGLKSTE